MQNYKKMLSYVGLAVAVVILTTVTTVYFSLERIRHSPVEYSSNTYVLKKGQTVNSVIDDLAGNFIDARVARFYAMYTHDFPSVQKGDYAIDGRKSLTDILTDMKNGKVIVRSYPFFTVVEGSNLTRILNKLSRYKSKSHDNNFEGKIKNQEKFIAELLKDHEDLLDLLPSGLDNLEGLLAPASYPMYEQDTFYSIFSSAVISQLKLLKREWQYRNRSDNISSPYEALILASLIERETFLDGERDMIAAVFENRLKKGMRLQTDPAVMYGVSRTFSGKLTRSHLKTDTPYNTYTRDGLPPTPICMPRAASIHAALHPARTKALYFVAKGISPRDGHTFSENLKDHNKAVSEYRQKVREYLLSLNSESAEGTDEVVSVAAAEGDAAGASSDKIIKDKVKSLDSKTYVAVDSNVSGSVTIATDQSEKPK